MQVRDSAHHVIIASSDLHDSNVTMVFIQVQLWHNNKGSSPGWYVKRVTVRDVDSGQSYYFLCESWLAVEECDGKVEREFMALDSHIGFSVVCNILSGRN